MLIYFDESYDQNNRYLLLGALFNPHPKFLHREWLNVKRESGFVKSNGKSLEVKYNSCTTLRRQKLCEAAIDIFIKSTSFFRAIAIDLSKMNLDYFGRKHEDNKIKTARAYKKFAELLLSHNTESIYNGVLLTDELTRCNGDKFLEIMKQDFCLPDGKYCDMPNRPTLKHIADIKSDLEEYHVNQINDILLGSILNNLFPTKKDFKNKVREHLILRLGVRSLLPSDWNRYSKKFVEEYYPKYNIWYWEPGKNQKTP